ncbi:helix-turn-helix transcriptional regulator [Mesorhizobium sp. CO1-1-8]|uniref:helix-turn-helix transcriptional regulator n=1 Tax=Mesorhizobium sp. CO1-1-8 TaxID=2876631 RepID=UPI001CD05E6B|nr:LuxR C-terminal-related transcriptional regulator [Mesorhizobium sp. CO1-1-8]MBZ9772419.1 LuxR C-terminal-related transcriptional regulator [Mesorhizobium sp. CO1-1-8]
MDIPNVPNTTVSYMEANLYEQYRALLLTVGSSDFIPLLRDTLNSHSGQRDFMVFSLGVDGTPSPLLLSEKQAGALVRGAAYLRRFHQYDPSLKDAPNPGRVSFVNHQTRYEAKCPFRQIAFAGHDGGGELTFSMLSDSYRVVTKFFVSSSENAAETQLNSRLSALSALILPLIDAHCGSSRSESAKGMQIVEQLEGRLERAFPTLSTRERAVCARTMIGMTAEGIGLALGIGRPTVLTYRRRAYERLAIGNSNQLWLSLARI